MIAYQQANPSGSTPTGLGDDGFARTPASVDIRGGRYVSNIAGIEVYNATVQSLIQGNQPTGTLSSSFALAGQIVNPRAFNLADLQALPSITRTVTVTSGSSTATRTFTGVSLWTPLTSAAAGGGVITDPSVKNDILGTIVVATGSDGYKATYPPGEFHQNFGADEFRAGGARGLMGFSGLVWRRVSGEPVVGSSVRAV